MEIWVTCLIVVAVVILVYWFAKKLPEPLNLIVQLIAIGGGAIWLITHMRELIHTIAGT